MDTSRLDQRKTRQIKSLERFRLVTVRFRPDELEKMDRAVHFGSYTSRAEFIRSCVRQRLAKYRRQQHEYLKSQSDTQRNRGDTFK